MEEVLTEIFRVCSTITTNHCLQIDQRELFYYKNGITCISVVYRNVLIICHSVVV